MSPSNEFRPEPQDGFTAEERLAWEAQFDIEEPTELADDEVDLYGADYGDDQPEWMQ